MKRLIASALVSAICIVSFAQNLRPVQGRVVNEDGAPMPGATITVKGYDASFTTDGNGDFTAEIPYGYNFLTANYKDYIPKTVEVDGSYMIFKLVPDKDAVRRRQEAQAKAEAERIAAEEEARRAAEAKAAAEKAARVKAEKERIAIEKKEEKAAKDTAYNEKYKNKGLAHSIEFGYNPCNMTGSVIYLYSGWREYTSFHPAYATYAISYKFNRTVSLGLGAGVLYNLKSCSINDDEFIPDENHSVAENFREKRLDVPVFINLRTSFCRTGVRPFIDVKAGMYCLSTTLLADVGVGCEFRIGRAFGMHILGGVSFVPVPDFMFGGFSKSVAIHIPSFRNNGYDCTMTPSVKIGFDF